jgi:cysteine desulfuration protein SufE
MPADPPDMPPDTPDEALAELADEFELLGDDWEERYRHLIDLGRALPPLTDAERSDANKVRGCASQVWLVGGVEADGRLRLRGDSDAHIVRGLVAVVLRLSSGMRAADVARFPFEDAVARLGLRGALSAQRTNGLAAMVARIRAAAA